MKNAVFERRIVMLLTPFALVLVLAVNGAIPFVMMPTSGQAFWSMGFAESIAKGPIWQIRASEFGLPRPAPIAFGLSGVLPASLLIRLGLGSSDAYTSVAALYLLLGAFSCWRVGRFFEARPATCLLAMLAWMTLPMIWQHVGYSMLSLAFAILPFYFWAALVLLNPGSGLWQKAFAALLFVLAAIVSVFMDGYTFVMFFCGASAIFVHSVYANNPPRLQVILFTLPVHVASFAIAYMLYSAYFGASELYSHPDSAFRAWGLDLSFALIPTHNVSFFADLLGYSTFRTNDMFFGDSSAYKTTYALPLLVIGITAWFTLRRKLSLANALILTALVAFYMSLGPSFKVFSMKPEGYEGVAMPAENALWPTGTNWITTHLPGFNVMRSAYRWMALCMICLWILAVMATARSKPSHRRYWLLAFCIVTLFNLPHLKLKGKYTKDLRQYDAVSESVEIDLKEDIAAGDLVAFVPWGNDFLANYLAPRVGFRTYNIGGDKNVRSAQSHWPTNMANLRQPFEPSHIYTAMLLLANTEADAVVFPYFDLLLSAENWLLPSERNAFKMDDPDFAAAMGKLREFPFLSVTDRDLYTLIRLKPEAPTKELRRTLAQELYSDVTLPVLFGAQSPGSRLLLRRGWHADEAEQVWSEMQAELIIPPVTGCPPENCEALIEFGTFGASADRPVTIIFETMLNDGPWTLEFNSVTYDPQVVSIPIKDPLGYQTVQIRIPEATSPKKLSGAPDTRVLGISIRRLDTQS